MRQTAQRLLWTRLLLFLALNTLLFAIHTHSTWAAPRTPTPTFTPPATYTTPTATPTSEPPPTATSTPVPPSPTPTLTPTPTRPTETPTSVFTPARPTPTPTPTLTPTPVLWLSGVEPNIAVAGKATRISLYGAGFIEGTIVRLAGIGVVETLVINRTVLQAIIPASAMPGTYAVEVIRPDGARVTLLNALTIVTPTPTPPPTPTPTPELPPPPGRPILMVSNYSLQPLTALPGHTLLVTVEIFNGGSRPAENALISFPGGTLVPVGETGHYVQHIPINGKVSVQQRFFVPKHLSAGTYQIPISMEGNDFEGTHYTYQATITVAVAEPPAAGEPLVVINRAFTQPDVLTPGQRFVLSLQLENAGDAAAEDLAVIVGDSPLIVPGAEGNRHPVGTLDAGAVVTVTLPLFVRQGVEPGQYSLSLALSYRDTKGTPLQTEEQVGVTVAGTHTAPPRVLLSSVRSQPEIPAPGDVVTLTLSLINVGDQQAKRLTLALGNDSQALSAFALLDTGNVRYVAALPPGQSVQVVQRLFVAGSARSGVYNIPLVLNYEDERGNALSETQLFSLRVRRRPLLQVRFYEEIAPPLVGQPFSLPVEVTNVSLDGLNVTTVEVRGDTVAVQGGSMFVGFLDGGATVSLDATAVAAEPGTHVIEVLVHYVDDFGHLQTWRHTLEVDVQAPLPTPTPAVGAAESDMAPGADKEEGFLQKIWQIIRGLLGLGS